MIKSTFLEICAVPNEVIFWMRLISLPKVLVHSFLFSPPISWGLHAPHYYYHYRTINITTTTATATIIITIIVVIVIRKYRIGKSTIILEFLCKLASPASNLVLLKSGHYMSYIFLNVCLPFNCRFGLKIDEPSTGNKKRYQTAQRPKKVETPTKWTKMWTL